MSFSAHIRLCPWSFVSLSNLVLHEWEKEGRGEESRDKDEVMFLEVGERPSPLYS